MADLRDRRIALRFIVLIGILSFFADFTYEGSRSIVGPYLATLQASGTVVGIVTGFGELLGYGLRLFSGRWADATGRYWPITIFGYVVQMASVPALALDGKLAGGGRADHSRTRRQGDPQSAARRDALARGKAGRRLWLGFRAARGTRPIRRHVRSARRFRRSGA